MATSTQQSGVSTGKRWCWRKPLCACWHRKILLLFFWQALFSCNFYYFGSGVISKVNMIFDLKFASMIISPFFGWLADVKLGRYKVIVFASLVSFICKILALIFGGVYLMR